MAEELLGLAYLRNKLALKKIRVDLRYRYYEMKKQVPDMGISTPPSLRGMMSVNGWCAAAVDRLADRLLFREFRNDLFDLNGIFQNNNPDVFFDSAILSALIAACCFVYISPDGEGFPRLQVLDGGSATGVLDPITNLLTEGYAVLKRDKYERPELEAYFTPDETVYYRQGKELRRDENPVGKPLLVPVIYRPDTKRPFGRSRISRSCMDIVREAARTDKRTEISAEFYSFPQKYVTGLADDEEKMENWKATMSSFLTATKDEDGESPKFGQFSQQSMEPHLSHLRMHAAKFAGETGLTLDDLGFPTDNPSSAEAIQAAHENLRLMARKAQRNFASGFLNAGYLAACLRDRFPYERRQLAGTEAVWEPVFEPDITALSGLGDAAAKINQAVPGFITAQTLHDMTGIAPGGGA